MAMARNIARATIDHNKGLWIISLLSVSSTAAVFALLAFAWASDAAFALLAFALVSAAAFSLTSAVAFA